jgi:hypothetical protein
LVLLAVALLAATGLFANEIAMAAYTDTQVSREFFNMTLL